MQIEGRLHERQGKAITNFSRTLPPPQSDWATTRTSATWSADCWNTSAAFRWNWARDSPLSAVNIRAFVVIDLKARDFQPEFVGKMNFYLAAVDDILRHDSDAPSIGLLLCRRKQALTVEYALRNVAIPIGVAEFVTDLARRIEAELNTDRNGVEASDGSA